MSFDICDKAIAELKKLGVKDAAVRVDCNTGIDVTVRERKVEKLENSDTAQISVAVYVDGRYGLHQTNDGKGLSRFLAQAVALTKVLEPDPHRRLVEPRLFEQRRKQDLALVDAAYASVDAAKLKAAALEVEAAALNKPDGIASVTTWAGNSIGTSYRVTTNGFRDQEGRTAFGTSASVTMKEGDKRPEDGAYSYQTHVATLPTGKAVGEESALRARGRLGAGKLKSGAWTLLIENRAAPGLVRHFLSALTGQALQQKRSFLDGMLGKQVMATAMTLRDEPWLEGAIGSRRFDGEGMATKPLPIVEQGVLRNYYIDHYYGSKLALAPTTGGPTNLVVAPGKQDFAALEKALKNAIVVTGFLGGNSNSLTGDFSLGLIGYAIENGKRTQAVSEMNLSGNHKDFWSKVAAVGSDPFLHGPFRVPSLVIDGAAVSGA